MRAFTTKRRGLGGRRGEAGGEAGAAGKAGVPGRGSPGSVGAEAGFHCRAAGGRVMAKSLTVDDIRVTGPDRDNADAFDPGATWEQARGFAEGGYDPATVAALFNEFSHSELLALVAWFVPRASEVVGTTLWAAWAALPPTFAR